MAESGNAGNFRTVLHGFHKTDVLQYIDAMKAQYNSMTQQYQSQLDDLRRQLSEKEAEASQAGDLREQLSQAEAARQAAAGESEQLRAQTQAEAERAQALLAQTRQELEALRREASSRQAQMQDLERRVRSLQPGPPVPGAGLLQEAENLIERLQDQNRQQAEQLDVLRAGGGESDAARRELETRLKQAEAEKQALEARLRGESAARAGERAAQEQNSLRVKALEAQLEEARARTAAQEAALSAEQARSRSLAIRAEELEASRRKTEALVGDAGAFVMEMYAMGQRFLEIAYRRGDSGLTGMETALDTLTRQVEETRGQIQTARQELREYGTTAGLRLDELAQNLEQAAGPVKPPASGEDKKAAE